MSSHLMSEMVLTADHLIIIGRGPLITDTPTDRFVESRGRRDMLVRSPQAADLAALLTAHGAGVTAESGGGLAVTGLEAPAIADLAAGQGLPVHELVPRHASLEDAYLDVTGNATEYRAPVLTTGAAGFPTAQLAVDVLAAGSYLVIVALLGLGLGVIIRSTAAAIAVLVALAVAAIAITRRDA